MLNFCTKGILRDIHTYEHMCTYMQIYLDMRMEERQFREYSHTNWSFETSKQETISIYIFPQIKKIYVQVIN